MVVLATVLIRRRNHLTKELATRIPNPPASGKVVSLPILGGQFELHQMRGRIVDLGGTLEILSAPGQATELVITLLPLTNERDDAYNLKSAASFLRSE